MGDKLDEIILTLEGEKSKSAAIIAGIGDAISIQDTNYKILYQNQVHKDIMGDHVGDYCYEAYEDRDSVCEGCPLTMCYSNGNIHKAERSTITDKGEIYVEITASPLTNPSGKIIGGIEVVRDRTEWKMLEENLRIQRNQAQQYLDVAGVMLLVLDTDQNITLINKKGCEILGYQEGELIGQNWFNTCIPDRIRKDVEDVFDGLMAGEIELTEYYENSVTIKSGDERIIAWHNTILRDKQNKITGVLSSGEDITEKKKLEAQYLHAQKMEAVGRLAGGIAHDFNNILSAIIANESLLHMNLKKDDPSREFAEEIRSLSARAAALTKGLLAFSRKQAIALKPVGINGIVSSIEKMLLRLIGEDIELRTKISEDDLIIMADSVQMEQVIMNLATNARDAMPDGGRLTIRTERTEIDDEYIQTHGFGEPGPFAMITMTDDGVGMDEETKEKIFEPFFSTKDIGRGTGLGLSTIYGIIKQHQGYVVVSSEPGKGASFEIYLPLTDKEVDEIRSPENAVTSERCTETILLAEDEEQVRRSLKAILNTFGHQVIEAINGKDAVEKFSENKDNIDLLLFDVIMPKKNGKEAYEEIKKIRPDIKVLFISGYTEDIMDQKGMLEEGTNIMYKPVTPGQLFRAIRETLS
jgi:PAS domain S-box-containing protein